MSSKEWNDKIANIKHTDEICFNCKYCIWAVALGIGVKCKNDNNKIDDKWFSIPNRFYTCEHFSLKE